MSVTINLLPNIRQEKFKAQQRKQVATVIGGSIAAAAVAVVVILYIVMTTQNLQISGLTKTINSNQDQLMQISGLVDAVTAEQHLASLPGLYERRVYLSKFFDTLNTVTPTTVALNSLNVDAQNILHVSGTAASYEEAAKLARALEGANVTVGDGANAKNLPYFTGVAIQSASRDAGNKVNFSMSATLASGVTSGQ